MAKVSIYYDTRYKSAAGKNPICYRIYLPQNRNFTIKTGYSVPPEWWDGEQVVKAPQRERMNRAIRLGRNTIEEALLTIQMTHGLQLKTSEIRDRIQAIIKGTEYQEPDAVTLVEYFRSCIAKKNKKTTADIYRHTLQKIEQFSKYERRSSELRFEDITIDWLRRFETFLKGLRLKVNGINLHFRNLRSVINAADDELTAHYPFRKFKLKSEETTKRSLDVNGLRMLMNYPCEPHQVKSRDFFMLIFYLIGINMVDLANLEDISNGYIEYRRSKTGKLYSIKVEPEALQIIEKYRGSKYLLDIMDTHVNYKDFLSNTNYNLKRIGEVERIGRGGRKVHKPLFPHLSTYWARHTWATIAADLDIPDETISLAMGHSSGNRITNVYIRRNQKKVNVANRNEIKHFVITFDPKYRYAILFQYITIIKK